MFEVADVNKDGVLDILEFGRIVSSNIPDVSYFALHFRSFHSK